MKNLKKIIALALTGVTVLSLVACSNDKQPNKVAPNGLAINESDTETYSEKTVNNKVVLSDKTYDFEVEICGEVYKFPTELNVFKENGWNYTYDGDIESKELLSYCFTTLDMVKDEKKITVSVFNPGESTKTLAECKVGGISCVLSETNDIIFNVANGLSLNRDASTEDVVNKFGDPSSGSYRKGQTQLTYRKADHSKYFFVFNKDNKLTYFQAENWEENEPSSLNTTSDANSEEQHNASTELPNDFFRVFI